MDWAGLEKFASGWVAEFPSVAAMEFQGPEKTVRTAIIALLAYE